MRKTSTIKKITVATGVALALVASVSMGSGKALASPTPGYLSAPDLYTTQVSGSQAAIVQTSAGDFEIYYTPTSLYGNTIPSTQQLQQFLSSNASSLTDVTPGPTGYTVTGTGATVPSNVTINQISDNGAPFYAISGITPSANGCGSSGCTLDLQLVNSITTNYSANNSSGTEIFGGQVLSNVFKVGAGSNLPGATQGELVFTYQFDVTYENATNGNVGPSAGSVSFYNDPAGYTYTLGSGSTDTSSISGTTIVCSTCTALPGGDLSGQVVYDTFNGSIETLNYLNNNGYLPVGSLSPEIFVASNAINYTIGSLTLNGNGAAFVANVFVPDTPEPGTLVLFGTALGLVAFMVVRNRRSQSVA